MFIDHPKNTLSYSINHALIKSCISQCSFQFQYFTISNQFKYAHKFNSVMQFNLVLKFNSVMPINSVMPFNSVLQFNSVMPFNSILQFYSVLPINSVMPLTNLTYVFDIQDIRVTGTVPLGCRPVSNSFITQYGPAWLLTGYKQSISEHYRYGPVGLLIGVTHKYNSLQYCYLTPIGIPIYP